jgi:hypothetical protein
MIGTLATTQNPLKKTLAKHSSMKYVGPNEKNYMVPSIVSPFVESKIQIMNSLFA